ncbi:MAG TPA: hypothetical protein VL049_16200 [Candidatus Dormibacteraeota bacterium]|nr:hypothetical protein [Candidatus Dormibacteraeota bacterium]
MILAAGRRLTLRALGLRARQPRLGDTNEHRNQQHGNKPLRHLETSLAVLRFFAAPRIPQSVSSVRQRLCPSTLKGTTDYRDHTEKNLSEGRRFTQVSSTFRDENP